MPGPVKPYFAIPTTAGTGSETTGVAIFDYKPLRAKTGIAHRRLKPTLGIVDPENTRTLPAAVAASSGLDVLCHAVESYTAIPYGERPRPARPILRPAYQGSNPISDIWSLEALRMTSKYLRRAVAAASGDGPADDEARANMMLAAAYAGVGFGNAGVHLPHGMSYPVAGLVRDYRAPGYAVDHPLVPHGVSVILNAPAVFRFTAQASPAASSRGGGSAGRRYFACQSEGRRRNSRRPDCTDDAGSQYAERLARAGIYLGRYSRAGGRDVASASGDETFAKTCRCGGIG